MKRLVFCAVCTRRNAGNRGSAAHLRLERSPGSVRQHFWHERGHFGCARLDHRHVYGIAGSKDRRLRRGWPGRSTRGVRAAASFARQRDRSVACANLPGHNPYETLGRGCRQPGGHASAHGRRANVGDRLSPRLPPERKRDPRTLFSAVSHHAALRGDHGDFRGLQRLADRRHRPGIPCPKDERFRSVIFPQALELFPGVCNP